MASRQYRWLALRPTTASISRIVPPSVSTTGWSGKAASISRSASGRCSTPSAAYQVDQHEHGPVGRLSERICTLERRGPVFDGSMAIELEPADVGGIEQRLGAFADGVNHRVVLAQATATGDDAED